MAISPEDMLLAWGYRKPRAAQSLECTAAEREAHACTSRNVAGGFLKGKSARIAYWLGALRYEPEWHEIMARWRVSRATAYRWAAFAREAATHNDNEPRD